MCLRSPPSHNPSSRFHIRVCCVAFATKFSDFSFRRRSSFSHGRPSGNVRGGEDTVLDPPTRSRTFPPHRKKKSVAESSRESRTAHLVEMSRWDFELNFCVENKFSSFSALFYLSFLF